MELKKRGIFFSTDALIAVVIVLAVILISYPIIYETNKKTEIHYDLLDTLSKIKVAESKNSYVQSLIRQGIITNLDNSLLEQIGEFYVTNISLARALTGSLLSDIETNRNIGIWFGNNLIFSKNNTPIENSKEIDVARRIISGINEGENITGFSARAFLTNTAQKKYVYFGGYVGDGNLSQIIHYNGNISSAILEISVNNNFDLYINGFYLGRYNSSISEFVPAVYNLPINFFHSGENILELKGTNLHVAGGFLKIVYDSDVEYQRLTKKNLPGVNGLINLYDGFYVPGKLNGMNILLHLDSSNLTYYFTIGNTTVIRERREGEHYINLSNSSLATLLDYGQLSKKTIPYRLGLENVSYISYGKADVFSVSDISGSMAPTCIGARWWCCFINGGCTTAPKCRNCGGVWEDKIGMAKEANKLFINKVLNYSQNRVGLVPYNNSVPENKFHNLSNNNASLIRMVESWSAGGSTCICCGINRAKRELSLTNNGSFESMVVMSDGLANVQCAEQGTGSATQDAIQAACEAYENHNITVYAIGFGSDADEATLQAIASCGHGEYYYADLGELMQVYEQIAESIISRYSEQTLEIEGNISTRLFPDSYIEFSYQTDSIPYGLILTFEKQFDDSYSGRFKIPENSSLLEAVVTSYSGKKWTDTLRINNNVVYNLSNYGNNFILLGDPYMLSIPVELVLSNQTNVINLTTSISSGNSSGGSNFNKIIYTVVRDFSSFSAIVSIAGGCNWHIQFEDNSEINVTIPANYSGADRCDYSEIHPSGLVANENDALQLAVRNLLRKLDFNSNGKVDVLFTSQQLQISTEEIVGIPFTWFTEVQIRVWS